MLPAVDDSVRAVVAKFVEAVEDEAIESARLVEDEKSLVVAKKAVEIGVQVVADELELSKLVKAPLVVLAYGVDC